MVTTLLIISIPITALVVGFLVLKSVQIGLRWQMEIKEEKQPTLDIPIKNPIQPILSSKAEKDQVNIFNEWLNGEPQ